jgi:hypothetical protein
MKEGANARDGAALGEVYLVFVMSLLEELLPFVAIDNLCLLTESVWPDQGRRTPLNKTAMVASRGKRTVVTYRPSC